MIENESRPTKNIQNQSLKPSEPTDTKKINREKKSRLENQDTKTQRKDGNL